MSNATLGLTVSSPPQSFTEPLTLVEVKTYLQIEQTDPPDNTDDALIDSLISAAREVFEIEQGRDLVQKQWDLTLDYFCERIELRDYLASVDLVRYRDSAGSYTTLAEGTGYIIDAAQHPGIIMSPYNVSWPSFTPWPTGAVLVRFTAGPSPTDAFWGGLGARLKQGMKALIKSWYIDEDPQNESGMPWAAQVLMRYGALPRVK